MRATGAPARRGGACRSPVHALDVHEESSIAAVVTWTHQALRNAPRIGLGLAALGRPAYITTGRDIELGDDRRLETMRRRTETVLDAAYESGVRYIDVARSYGFAEDFLAGWLALRHLDPADIAVGSKWGYTYVGKWR